MRKTIDTIQKLFKVGRVISRIVFVACLVGAIVSFTGILCLAMIPDGFRIGGMTLRGIIATSQNMSMGAAYLAAAVAMVFCASESFLGRMAARYFSNELQAGTPFTQDGAKELIRLGIFNIVIPIAAVAVMAIIYAIIHASYPDLADLRIDNLAGVGIGVMMIVTGLICRYGAEQKQMREDHAL